MQPVASNLEQKNFHAVAALTSGLFLLDYFEILPALLVILFLKGIIYLHYHTAPIVKIYFPAYCITEVFI